MPINGVGGKMAFGSVGDAELEGSKLGFDERMSHLYTFFFNDFLLGIIGCYHMVIYGKMVNLDFVFRFTNEPYNERDNCKNML